MPSVETCKSCGKVLAQFLHASLVAFREVLLHSVWHVLKHLVELEDKNSGCDANILSYALQYSLRLAQEIMGNYMKIQKRHV